MTELLAKAFETVSTFPESIQDEIARELLEEAEWEKNWEREFSEGNVSGFDKLALQALEEFNAGKTIEAGWDEL